jgi:hypothetical protein
MGLSEDPQAFVPAQGQGSLRETGNPDPARAGDGRANLLDPLVAALGRAVERSAQSPHHRDRLRQSD